MIQRQLRMLLIALVLAALAGCARTPPAQYYLLTAPAATTVGAADGPRLGLGPVRLPEYLDRPQIVSWASATRLTLSNQHRWAEPLAKNFSRVLFARFAQAQPAAQIVPWPWRRGQTPARQIVVDVQRFERGADDMLHLDVRWTVQSATADTPARAFDTALALPVSGAPDDYDTLVAAASEAVGALAADIAKRLPQP